MCLRNHTSLLRHPSRTILSFRRFKGLAIMALLALAWIGRTDGVAASDGSNPGLQFDLQIRSGNSVESSITTWWNGWWMDQAEDSTLIIHVVTKEIFILDHTRRTFTGGPADTFLAEMERKAERVGNLVHDAYGLKGKTEDTSRIAPHIQVEPIGNRTIRGRKCRYYKMWHDQKLVQEVWLDPSLRYDRYFPHDQLISLLTRFLAANAAFSRQFRSSVEYRLEQEIQAQLLKLSVKGQEIRSRDYRNGQLTYQKDVINFREWLGSEEAFKIPAAYRHVAFDQFFEDALPDTREPSDDERP